MNVCSRTLLALLLFLSTACRAATYENSPLTPPLPPREFRGTWIATVANIDWPSKPGLSAEQQKAELVAIFNRAAQLKLNAVIFQVRPACDAMYASTIEPWSEYLTGAMGKAPEPYYDPLAFAVAEAHKRGMELHAWFNPYRALHKSHQGSVSANHVSKTHPQFVHSYGEYLWLDPGDPAVQEYSLRVVMDVVKRYDIDGVQFDDYFYPDPTGVNRDFPDEASWRKFGENGKLSRDEWRHENVNSFIHRVYDSIKAAKPWVKFGVSPPGIWRPGNPPQIEGSDSYTKLYADSRKWLLNGWLDYCSPQLYWPIEDTKHSFPVLLKWWDEQNAKGRHIWPGLATYKMTTWPAEEIPNQIEISRRQPGSKGYILYSATNLVASSALTRFLERESTALVPASPWLGKSSLPKPNLSVADVPTGICANWNSGTNAVRWWVVQRKSFGNWNTDVLPGETLSKVFTGVPPEVLSVTAIDRAGNASPPHVLEIKRNPAHERILLKNGG